MFADVLKMAFLKANFKPQKQIFLSIITKKMTEMELQVGFNFACLLEPFHTSW